VKTIRVVHSGLGPIGCETVRTLLEKKDVRIVGAVDIDPGKIGRDLGEILGAGRKLGTIVSEDAAAVFRKSRPHVLTHTTTSSFQDVYDQLALAAGSGVHVVSSTEELVYPQLRNPALAGKLDRIARRNGAAIFGTGVNPGFVMDTLALVLTGVSRRIRKIGITRRVDASTRRMPLQRKVGAGMKPAEFRQLIRQGKLGHIGLLESMYLVALGVGWTLDRHTEKIEPVVAESLQETDYFTVRPGYVAGIAHTASGFCGGRRVIDLELHMYIGAPDPVDSIEIDGDPPLTFTVAGGVPGDLATVAAVVNAIPRVLEAQPGLKTMLDLPIPRAFRAV
jgi:hypothetical protein